MVDVSHEQVQEALEVTHGLIQPACQYIFKTWGIKIAPSTIEHRIKLWGMEDYVYDLRRRVLEKVLNRRIENAIRGDNFAAQWLLEKFGHHVNWLKPREEMANKDQGTVIAVIDHMSKSDSD